MGSERGVIGRRPSSGTCKAGGQGQETRDQHTFTLGRSLPLQSLGHLRTRRPTR